MYVYCVVCYRVIAAPYVRSVVISLHIVTLLMMIRNAQWTMSSHYSLQPEVVFLFLLSLHRMTHFYLFEIISYVSITTKTICCDWFLVTGGLSQEVVFAAGFTAPVDGPTKS